MTFTEEERIIRNREKVKRHYRKYPERVKTRGQKYRAANREKVRAFKAAWRLANPDKVREQKRRSYQRHKEEIKRKNIEYYKRVKNNPEVKEMKRESLKRWRAENRERYRANDRRYIKESRPKRREVFSERDRIHAHRRRTLKMGAEGRHTKEQWLSRVEFYGWCCAYCGKHLTRNTLTQDHRIPLAKGGTNFASNLVPACSPCNSKKNDR